MFRSEVRASMSLLFGLVLADQCPAFASAHESFWLSDICFAAYRTVPLCLIFTAVLLFGQAQIAFCLVASIRKHFILSWSSVEIKAGHKTSQLQREKLPRFFEIVSSLEESSLYWQNSTPDSLFCYGYFLHAFTDWHNKYWLPCHMCFSLEVVEVKDTSAFA